MCHSAVSAISGVVAGPREAFEGGADLVSSREESQPMSSGQQEQVATILSGLQVSGLPREQRRGQVLPVLQRIQRALGYIPRESLPLVARTLGVPESHLFGVATFYSQFRFSPPGRNSVTVCCGTACHVRGSGRLLDDLKQRLGIGPGETTPDQAFSLDRIACFGSCALAPVVVVNGKVRGRMNRSRLLRALEALEPAKVDGEAD